MKANDISWFRDRFSRYVSTFYINDNYHNKNIRVKEKHTLRVCKNILAIANSLNLNKDDKNLCEIIALFHDIGRFEQFRIYRTFNDKLSKDHASLGLEIIEKEKIFQSLDHESFKVACGSIRYHNKKNLYKNDPDDRTVFFSKLIRDADKLDILKVLTGYYNSVKSSNPALVLDLPESDGFTSDILQKFLESKSIDSSKLKSRNDFKLLLMSWTFDINFDYTKNRIEKKKYFDRILSTIPEGNTKNRIRLKLQEEFISSSTHNLVTDYLK